MCMCRLMLSPRVHEAVSGDEISCGALTEGYCQLALLRAHQNARMNPASLLSVAYRPIRRATVRPL